MASVSVGAAVMAGEVAGDALATWLADATAEALADGPAEALADGPAEAEALAPAEALGDGAEPKEWQFAEPLSVNEPTAGTNL